MGSEAIAGLALSEARAIISADVLTGRVNLGQQIEDPSGIWQLEFWNRSLKHIWSLDGTALRVGGPIPSLRRARRLRPRVGGPTSTPTPAARPATTSPRGAPRSPARP